MNYINRRLAVFARKSIELPEDVIAAFEKLGADQRGKPEYRMLDVQKIAGGGVLSPLVEHLGDITHRMSHMARWGNVMGAEKVLKTLRWLNNRYGFEREYRENVKNNARYDGVDPEELQQEISAALRNYAAAHAKLVVYNRAQWLAREAAVAVGMENFDKAREYLTELAKWANNENTFTRQALKFTRDSEGRLKPYEPKTGRKLPAAAAASYPNKLTIELSQWENLRGLLDFWRYVKDTANSGHSFSIEADRDSENSPPKAKVFVDGDGSDHVGRIFLNDKDVSRG